MYAVLRTSWFSRRERTPGSVLHHIVAYCCTRLTSPPTLKALAHDFTHLVHTSSPPSLRKSRPLSATNRKTTWTHHQSPALPRRRQAASDCVARVQMLHDTPVPPAPSLPALSLAPRRTRRRQTALALPLPSGLNRSKRRRWDGVRSCEIKATSPVSVGSPRRLERSLWATS